MEERRKKFRNKIGKIVIKIEEGDVREKIQIMNKKIRRALERSERAEKSGHKTR